MSIFERLSTHVNNTVSCNVPMARVIHRRSVAMLFSIAETVQTKVNVDH
jgi:chemotaxis protein CheY-P-specific phosphatase CheC